MKIERLNKIASKADLFEPIDPPAAFVEQSIDYLSCAEAFRTIEDDPYWPKWNGPWWQMLLLFEMGWADKIPRKIVEFMSDRFNRHYLHFFPFTEAEVPAGRDPIRDVICHCALGSMHQILHASGIDLHEAMPWVTEWYSKYQLEDGGLNCDEAAYTRGQRKSSVVSSLPPLEAVLYCSGSKFTDEQIQFLDNGAQYLIKRRLFRSAKSGSIIDQSWTELCFPRFYHYDILRGLSFLLNWAIKLKRKLPLQAIEEAVSMIDRAFPEGRICIQRRSFAEATTRWKDSATGEWTKVQAFSYDLLDALSAPGSESVYLNKHWSDTKNKLRQLLADGLIS